MTAYATPSSEFTALLASVPSLLSTQHVERWWRALSAGTGHVDSFETAAAEEDFVMESRTEHDALIWE